MNLEGATSVASIGIRHGFNRKSKQDGGWLQKDSVVQFASHWVSDSSDTCITISDLLSNSLYATPSKFMPPLTQTSKSFRDPASFFHIIIPSHLRKLSWLNRRSLEGDVIACMEYYMCNPISLWIILYVVLQIFRSSSNSVTSWKSRAPEPSCS